MNCQPISEVPEGHAPDLPVEVNGSDYPEISRRFPFLVIDCWAPWCGPCKQITPIMEQLHEQYKGTMTFGFLNTDDNQELAMEFGIMGIPTILVVKDGRHVDSLVGVMPKSEVERRLKEHLDG
jgi:thioredoxin 1